MQRHGGLLSTATATVIPSAPPSTAPPSAPLTPAPTLSTAATGLLRRFSSLLLPSPALPSSTAVTTAAAVQRRWPVQLWGRKLLWRGWGG